MTKIEEIIKYLELEPLEKEGGLFRSTYRSQEKIGERNMSSAIYFMLTGEGYSHLHRLSTDEVYHFYSGDPVEMLELLPDGSSRRVILGGDVLAGQKVQYVVEAGNWQGSRLVDGGEYALLGTTMSPGFEIGDYQHAEDIQMLLKNYPEQEAMIKKLTGETKFL